MQRFFLWLVLLGGLVVSLGIFWQAFSIVTYVRTGDDAWVDRHAIGSGPVHLGQLAIVIGAIVAGWGNWRVVGGAIGFLVLSVVQLMSIGNTDEGGSWVNGFHGLFALVMLLAALGYVQWSARKLGLKRASAAPESA